MTASATVAPKVRKTRTRKPRAKAVKAVAPKTKRPSTAKLITPTRYLNDIKTRWAIHQYEIKMLSSDLTKGFNTVKPYAQRLVDQFTK